MNRPELFHRTVEILTNSLQNGTLEHNDCSACAIGNLVAANMYNGDAEKIVSISENAWSSVFYTNYETGMQAIRFDNYKGRAKEQIDSTGYSLEECCAIEIAFELAPAKCITEYKLNPKCEPSDKDPEWMVNGLRAVYDVLCDIHEVGVAEVAPAKEVFA